MLSKLIILGALASALCAPGYGQDSQSLGDLARQVRSQKKAAQSGKILTNDDLSSASTANLLGLEKSDPANSVKPGATSSALASLTLWESVVKQIDSMDRATLSKMALRGANPDFPGHQEWEERLFAAKQAYVSQGLGLIERARQLLAQAEALDKAQAKPDDPRAAELSENLKGLVRETVRADAAFQAVILEGRDLAQQAPAR